MQSWCTGSPHPETGTAELLFSPEEDDGRELGNVDLYQPVLEVAVVASADAAVVWAVVESVAESVALVEAVALVAVVAAVADVVVVVVVAAVAAVADVAVGRERQSPEQVGTVFLSRRMEQWSENC